MAAIVELSDTEWQVMNLVWEHQPIMAQDVIGAPVEPCELSQVTVRTMLHRLQSVRNLDFPLATSEKRFSQFRSEIQ